MITMCDDLWAVPLQTPKFKHALSVGDAAIWSPTSRAPASTTIILAIPVRIVSARHLPAVDIPITIKAMMELERPPIIRRRIDIRLQTVAARVVVSTRNVQQRGFHTNCEF